MLKIGPNTISQRLAATLRQAGIGRIVMVTGYNAEELESHLAETGVVFQRNEAYETTQMVTAGSDPISSSPSMTERL